MILVRTVKKQSPIEGVGLFADEFIAKGTPVWRFQPGFDLKLSPEEVTKLPAEAEEEVREYAYLSRKSGTYILCSDDGRFINHSEQPNLVATFPGDAKEDVDVALRDIEKGEEITIDYRELESKSGIAGVPEGIESKHL